VGGGGGSVEAALCLDHHVLLLILRLILLELLLLLLLGGELGDTGGGVVEPPHLLLFLLLLLALDLLLLLLLLLEVLLLLLEHLELLLLLLGQLRRCVFVQRLERGNVGCPLARHHRDIDRGGVMRERVLGLEHRNKAGVLHDARRGRGDVPVGGVHAVVVEIGAVPAGVPGVDVLGPVLVLVLLLNVLPDDDLELRAEDDAEAVAADGLFDAGDPAALAPLVELAAEGVCLDLEEAEFPRGEEAVALGGVDVCDGGVDDGGLGRAADLGQVGEEGCEVEETTVESLSSLAFDGVVGRPALGGVCAPAGFAFYLWLLVGSL
jgi:hypothetical protein